MKYLIQIMVLFLLFTSISTAQTIYVSDTITEDNEPINANNQWEIDPWGKILAQLDLGEGIVVADIELDRLAEIREDELTKHAVEIVFVV